MSVINQMLRDLEQRRAVIAESPLAGVSAGHGVLRSTPPMNYVVKVSLLVLAVLIAFIVGGQRSGVSYPESLPVEPPAVASNTTAPSTIETPLIKPASVLEAVVSSPDSPRPVNTQPEGKTIQAELTAELDSAPEVFSKHDTDVAELSAAKEPEQREITKPKIAQTTPKNINAANITEKRAKHDSSPILRASDNAQVVDKESAEEVKPVSPVVMDKRIHPLTDYQQAQQLFQEAVLQLGRGHQNQAHKSLNAALSVDPSHLRARETLAALLLNSGRVSESGAVLRDGLRINPTAAGLAKLYGRILADQGDTEQSIAVLERARPPVSDDPEYHALMAAFYARAGQHYQAVQIYQNVLQARQGVSQWWMGLGLSLEAVGESAQALTSYQRAQRLGGLPAEVNKYVAGRIQALSQPASVEPSGVDNY